MFNSKTSSLKMVLFAGMALLAAAITLAVTPAAHADYNGGAGAAVGGGGGGGGTALAPIWWTDGDSGRDWPANYNGDSTRSILKERYPGMSTSRGIFNVVASTEGNAINDCKNKHGGQCRDPRVVAVGWKEAFDNSPGPNGFCNMSPQCIGPDGVTGGLTYGEAWPVDNRWLNVEGNTFTTRTNLSSGGSVFSLADNAVNVDGTKKRLVVVVLSRDDYESKGWYPTYGPHERVDVASANKISSHKFAPCAAYYYMTATGVDGYVRGMATKTTKYQTPYGKLYDAVQTGGTWKSAAGKTYGPFTGNWAQDDAKLKELEEARNVSCDETQKMTITYDFGNAVAGASDKGFDGTDKSDEKSGDGVIFKLKGSDFDSKDKFLEAYAKGGIYKIIKSKKDATITGKTTDVKYFYRNSNWYEFTGWRECRKGQVITAKMMGLEGWPVASWVVNNWSDSNDNKCGYIGQKKPSGPPRTSGSIDMRDDYNSGNTHATADGRDHGFYEGVPYDPNFYGTSAHWQEATDKQTVDDIKNLRNHIYVGGGKTRELSVVFNRGYATKFRCGGVEVTADQVGQNHDMNTQSNCEAIDWAFQNDIIGYWQAVTVGGRNTGNLVLKWAPGGKEAFANGMPLHGNAESTLNKQLHPVSNRFQSVVTVSYQDFVNMNCNQIDFNNYVNSVRDQQTALDLGDDKILQVDTNTKFNQTAHTGVISREDTDKLGWKTLAEVTPRVMGSTHVTRVDGSKWVNGLNAADVMGSGDVDGQKAGEYTNLTHGKYWVGYKAELDPIYSKECPFDCTADQGQTGNATVKNNVTDAKNSPTDEDKANGATGVKVQATDARGNIVSADKATNTANMVFFRNGEWNKFVVDLYAPVTGSTNVGQVSYDGKKAKSTIITRDPKGTTWFAKDTGTQLTTMQANQGGTYKDIFTGNSLDEKLYADQLQSKNADGSRDGISVALSGQVNDFQIESKWATEAGLPLKFQIKWEYDATAHVSIPDSVSFGGTGTPNGSTSANIAWRTVDTTVDGKCLSQQNTHLPSPDTTVLNHDSSGSGRDDVDDRTFRQNGEFGVPQRGWFQVTFVRATAE